MTVSAITSPDRTGAKVYYQSGHFACYPPGGEHWILAHHYKQWKRKHILAKHTRDGGAFQEATSASSYYWGSNNVTGYLLTRPLPVPTNPASVRTITHFRRSGLVIDFATSPVRTGNSFFDKWRSIWALQRWWIARQVSTTKLRTVSHCNSTQKCDRKTSKSPKAASRTREQSLWQFFSFYHASMTTSHNMFTAILL